MSRCTKVDKDTCIGCGMCVALYEEAYIMDDEGKAEATQTPDSIDEQRLEETIGECPVEAISWDE